MVEPARADIASGINSILRQVGIATGVTTLGTILVSHVHSSVLTGLQGTPLAGHAHAVSIGGSPDAIASTPQPLRGLVALTPRSALVQGLNAIMLISAVVAFAAAVDSFVLIRERDFVALDEGEEEELEPAVAA